MQSENLTERDLNDLLVIKFGGKSLSDSQRIRNLAKKTIEFHKNRPVLVVVSAMDDDTNRLIKLADMVSGGDCTSADLTEIVSFGENLSATVFATTLKSLGATSQAITPTSSKWPIFGTSHQQIKLAREKINQNVDVEILEEKSRSHAMEGIGNLLKSGIIPVVSGFLALSEDGNLLTLGRGGSDTSAFLLGKLLGASEVLIVTDVGGVLKADPTKVDDPERVNYISVDEIDTVTRSGGQVLHPQSLSFKTDRMKTRIVHFDEADSTDAGTEIIGFYKARLKGIQKKLALINIIGEDLSSFQSFWSDLGVLLSEISTPLFGLSFTENFIGFYIADEAADEFFKQINEFVKNKPFIKNVIQRRDIARMNLSSRDNAENPEMISDICDTLLERGIQVLDVITNQSDISVFVSWIDREKAGKSFKRMATDMNLREVLNEES